MRKDFILGITIHVDAVFNCGDGLCRSPENRYSCSSDCPNFLRNPDIIVRQYSSIIPSWNSEGTITVNGNRIIMNNDAILTQEIFELGHGIPHEVFYEVIFPPIGSNVYHTESSHTLYECIEVMIFTEKALLFSNIRNSRYSRPPYEFIIERTHILEEEPIFFGISSHCKDPFIITEVVLSPVSDTKNLSFDYATIYDSIIGTPTDLSEKDCKHACYSDDECVAWEVCPIIQIDGSVDDGCGGCYLLGRAPDISSVIGKELWHAGMDGGRMHNYIKYIDKPRILKYTENLEGKSDTLVESIISTRDPPFLTPEICREHLLGVSAHEEGFYDESKGRIQIFNDCGIILRTDKYRIPKQIFVGGSHYPVLLTTNHRIPEPVFEDPLKYRPFFLSIPFYDTNIGDIMKHTTTMNLQQSYQMQSMVQPGMVFVDIGANLGSYAIPMAHKLTESGMVLAFEPFRLIYQQLTANVALNGLMNVHSFNCALHESDDGGKMLYHPMLRFFSSPGGARVDQSVNFIGEKDYEQNKSNEQNEIRSDIDTNLYDKEWGQEYVKFTSLDKIIFGEGTFPRMRPRVDLVKIDVEGMELEVVKGAAKTIERFKPLIWSENVDFFEKGDMRFTNYMESKGYQCVPVEVAFQDLLCKYKV